MSPTHSTYSSYLDSNTSFDDQLELLGWGLAEHGCGPFEGTIQALAAFARIHEVAPVAAAVLVDVHEPEVARVRAFGHVVRRLSAPPAAPDVSTRFEPTAVSA